MPFEVACEAVDMFINSLWIWQHTDIHE
jgi:hypothetical protein